MIDIESLQDLRNSTLCALILTNHRIEKLSKLDLFNKASYIKQINLLIEALHHVDSVISIVIQLRN